MVVEIQPFEACHAAAVSALNRAWLEGFGLLEPPDERYLSDPAGEVIDAGGAIFVALIAGEVVGTCAALPHEVDAIEVVKLAVTETARGRGVGRRLVETALAFGRTRGATRATLISSSKLEAALRLYASMGFESRPLPIDQPYATADVYMEKDLTEP